MRSSSAVLALQGAFLGPPFLASQSAGRRDARHGACLLRTPASGGGRDAGGRAHLSRSFESASFEWGRPVPSKNQRAR